MRQLLFEDALVLLNGGSSLELLAFSSLCISDLSELLSGAITMVQMEPHPVAMPLFSASFYCKLFPPKTFEGMVCKCNM